MKSFCLRFALLALASLLFLQLTTAQSDSAACAENCRFVVVPSLGPAGPRGLNGTNGAKGEKGEKGDKGDAATLDASQTYLDVKFLRADLSVSKVWDSRITGGYTTNSEFWDGFTYNVVMRSRTEIGFPSDITPEALNPVTKIYRPEIFHGILSGATKILDGSTLDRPAIDSPQITGATTIGEGATLVKPTIDAPIIKNAAFSGTVAGMVHMNQLTTGPDVGTACRGSTNETRLTLSLGNIGWSSIGSVIKWADNSSSVVVDTATSSSGSGTAGRINDEQIRTDMDCVLYKSNNNFLSSGAFDSNGVAVTGSTLTSIGQPVIHHNNAQGGRVVILSLGDMPVRNKAVWSFPTPPTAIDGSAYNDTFVGRDMAQTIANKTLQTVPSLEFTSAANTSAALNNRDYTDASAIPVVPAKAPVAAVGSTLLDFYETVRFQLPVTGHLKALNATGSPVPIWSTVTCTRIGRAVIMNAEELLVEKVNLIRPAESIWFGANNINHRLPVMCRPNGNRHFYTTVQDGAIGGIHKPGRLVVFFDGRMRVDVQKSDLTFGPFGEIANNTQVYSGFQSLSASWNF